MNRLCRTLGIGLLLTLGVNVVVVGLRLPASGGVKRMYLDGNRVWYVMQTHGLGSQSVAMLVTQMRPSYSAPEASTRRTVDLRSNSCDKAR